MKKKLEQMLESEYQLNILIQEQLNTQEKVFHTPNSSEKKLSKEEKINLWNKLQRINSAICAFKMCGVSPEEKYQLYFDGNFVPEKYFIDTCSM